MAELILRVRVDPVTGKRELIVDYGSDADALPIEHEQAHRQLANRVVEGKLGQLEVSRGSEPAPEAAESAEQPPVAEPVPTRR
jgi:hypothetical protein